MPFADAGAWLRPGAVTQCRVLTPQEVAVRAALRRLLTADDAYLREHTLSYSRMVRGPDGALDWQRGPDGAPIFRVNVESEAGRALVNAKLRAERAEVLGYRAHRRAQSTRAKKPRADEMLVGIVRRLARRDDTVKALWEVLFGRLDAQGCRPAEHAGADPRQWRIDYIDADGRARKVTLDTFGRMLKNARRTQ